MWRVSSASTTSASASSRSTRSVTSSRFPIGVAQTASGTSPPPSASNATIPAPITPASVPSCASTIRTVSRAGSSPSIGDHLARRPEQQLARLAEPAADDHHLGLEDVDEARDAGAQVAADPGRAPRRLGSPRPARGARARARSTPSPYSDRATRSAAGPGGEGLEVPVPAAAAGRAARLDHDVAELGSAAGGAAVRAAVQDQAAADPGAEREHHDVPRPACGARPPLGDRRGVAVVVERDRQAVPLAHPVAQVDALERDVHGLERAARALVDPRRDPEAERLRHRALRGAAPRPSRRARRAARPARSASLGRSMRAPERAVARDDRGEDLRPADVDPDDPRLLQNARVPYAAGCRHPAERSPTASTGAGARRAGCRRSAGPRSRRLAPRPTATGAAATAGPGPKTTARRPRQIRWGRELTIALVLIVALLPRLGRARLPRRSAAASRRRTSGCRRTRAAR